MDTRQNANKHLDGVENSENEIYGSFFGRFEKRERFVPTV
jgi:hypothetical protein